MMITIKKGDLFALNDSYVLGHCISLDCAMGAGIAKQFDTLYPKMKPKLKQMIIEKQLNYPVTILYKPQGERWVFNLITKQKYWNKPTYITITSTIQKMAKICKERHITKLGLPLIGCGLDKLEWSKVKKIIEEAFKDQDIDIQIRYK